MGDDVEPTSERPRNKRARVAVACQRCKSRKQKCDGNHPACGNCLSFNAQCIYVMPENRQATKEQYLRALEQRVNQLESALSAARDINAAGGGITPLVSPALEQPGQIQWIPPPPSLQRSSHYSNLDRAELPSLSIPSPTMIAHDSLAGKPEDHIDPKSVNSVTDILRDLSIEASGGYIGASSNITMGRMIGTLVKSKESQNISNMKSPKSLYQPASPASTRDNIQSNLLKGDVCDRLLLGYLKHISLRWPILRTSFIRALHNQREILVEPYKKTVLHLVYAIGGRFLETTGQAGTFFTEEHHSAALQQLDDILAYHDVRSIIVLLLLAIHSLRAPKGPGAWTYVGLAMRLCIDLGLHRKRGPSHLQINNPRALADLEMRKRVFWTAYCLDRQVSIVLGRPFAISDRDIDADLPLDVNEDMEDQTILAEVTSRSAIPKPPGNPTEKPTSLSCFIHLCRLRIIESNVQQSIYRVDDPSGASPSEVERYIQQLEAWRTHMPRHDLCNTKPHNFDMETTLDGYDYYIRPHLCCQRVHNNVCESQMVYFYKCMRFLLHPHLLSRPTNPRFLAKCVDACGGVCQTYKRLHQRVSIGFSLMALHSVFLAGLTLVYCIWISPKEVFGIKTSNDINACSIVLYIITERWPGAKKYRDVFENVKQTVLESIEANGYEERKAIKDLTPSLYETWKGLDEGTEGRNEFEAMVGEMAGELKRSDKPKAVQRPETGSATSAFTFEIPSGGVGSDSAHSAVGVDFGRSPSTFSNQWLLGIDSGVGVEGFSIWEPELNELQFPME